MAYPRGVKIDCVRCKRRRRPNARRLCSTCWRFVGPDGRLDYPCVYRTRDEVMTEWELFRTSGRTKREAAAAMGMNYTALDRAIYRARALGDPRAGKALPQPARWKEPSR